MGTEGYASFLPLKSIVVASIMLLPMGATAPTSAQTLGPKALPVVLVLATGGTIAGIGASATDLSNYKSGTLLGEELVAAVPQIKQYAEVKVEQIVNIASYDLTLGDWISLANRINQIFTQDPSVAGVVVTHGTSTLEETVATF